MDVIEEEGEYVDSNDYLFDRIGEPLNLHLHFDPQNLPSQPLAVSQQHQILFVSHSQGFCVSNINDVIHAANNNSLSEFRFLDVPIGNVNILSLSSDSSTLVASVSPLLHFFNLTSLLNKQEQTPFFSTSLPDSAHVKDFRWTNNLENSYVLLSTQLKLYHGSLHPPLRHVMDNVDAVEWSVKGKFVVVARNNILSILTSKFKERSSMSLSFKLWTEDCDPDCIVKVDSIRWIRADSIIIGCFQLAADGKEENYLVQVISTKDGKLTDASNVPVALFFNDLFEGLIDDIVPSGTGPHMFCSYLRQCELAIVANRKNTDKHIVVFSWSLDNDQNEAKVVDFNRDKWLPRIELQENGDDNLILGLGIAKPSPSEKVKVQLGVEEPRELSPYCVLLCLTLEGKLILFHVAGLNEPPVLPVANAVSDEEENTAAVVHVEHDPSKVSSEVAVLDIQSHEMRQKGDGENPENGTAHAAEQISLNKSTSLVNPEMTNLVNSRIINTSRQQNTSFLRPNKTEDAQQSLQNPILEPFSLKTSHTEGPSKSGAQNSARFGSSTLPIVGKVVTATSIQSQTSAEEDKEIPSIGLKSALFQSGSTVFSKDSDGTSLFSHPTFRSSNPNIIAKSPANVPEGLTRTSMFPKESATLYSSTRTTSHSEGQRGASWKSPNSNLQPNKDSYRTSRMSTSEPILYKQFGNVEEMAQEMDKLLQCIEEEGGFRDACFSQQGRVLQLEHAMEALSGSCTMWKRIMDERLEDIDHLLDRTVEVNARKVHMESIVKQASDTQYWDLWNRQMLSSELEMKRVHILKINQDLTTRLIDLERHFNSLELNKFGESSGGHAGHKAIQSGFGPPRHVQSLHSLHSTMNSQLEAAERLSECLSKQLAVLRIEDTESQQRSVKKELFEAIGLPFDDGPSFSSPASDALSIKKLPFSSSVVSTKDEFQSSRRKPSTAIKTCEPETARRRRDSLDKSWTSLEPPKTTVKRMQVQQNVNKSPLSVGKIHYNNEMQDVSPNNDLTPSALLYHSGKKATQDTPAKSPLTSLFKWANDSPGPSQSVGFKSPAMPFVSSISAATQSSSSLLGPNRVTAERIDKSDLVSTNKTMPTWQPEVHLRQTPSISTVLPPHTEIDTAVTNESLTFDLGRRRESPFSSVSVLPVVSKDQMVEKQTSLPFKISSTPKLVSSSVPAKSSTEPKSSVAMSFGGSLNSSKATTDGMGPTPPFPSLVSSSFPAPADVPFPLKSTVQFPKSEAAPSQTKTDVNLATETSLSASTAAAESSSNLTPTVSSAPTVKVSSGDHSSFNNAVTAGSNRAANARLEQPYNASPPFPSLASSEKNESLDVAVCQEDEMEEEAPEANVATMPELTLGSLGGFGIGSSPNPNAPKVNPFGGPFSNAGAGAATPFNMTIPSGELFRPASFTFQSPQPTSQPSPNPFSGQPPTGSGFGQPAQVGAGQQALGSVLGSFGQSRQLGSNPPTPAFASPAAFGSGFAAAASAPSTGGFVNAAPGNGFAAAASGGGFAAAAASGGGFATAGGGGFGGFGSQQGRGGFSAFGSGAGGAARPQSNLFTQIRK